MIIDIISVPAGTFYYAQEVIKKVLKKQSNVSVG
jgi:hypothetical protein